MYAIANNLKGFKVTSLRVKVTRREGDCVWVITADLVDAGTPLVLSTEQVKDEQPETAIAHKTGLVLFS